MQGLTVQCPHCLHLVQVASGYLKNSTIYFDCMACKVPITLPHQEKVDKWPSSQQQPKAIALPEDPLIPQIEASDLQALEPEENIQDLPTLHPLPEQLANQIAGIEPDKPGSTGIKNAFCRLWEEDWENSTAHENFLQKANQQKALHIGDMLADKQKIS